MPLTRRLEPFSHPDWLLEIKHDGFRALAPKKRATLARGASLANCLSDYLSFLLTDKTLNVCSRGLPLLS
jgi:hypothetical protein